MYKIQKKKRTTKELFNILRQKVLAFCKNQPKMPPPELNHTEIIFPGAPIFKAKGDKIDYGEPSISKSELVSSAQYLEYDFPMQAYHLKFDNTVLNPLKYQNLFSFSDDQLLNRKPLCLSSYESSIVVGWSNGIVMLFHTQDIKNIAWLKLPATNPITHIDIIQKTVVLADSSRRVYMLQLINNQLKTQAEHLYIGGQIHMMKAIKAKNSTVILISDSEGNLSKLTIKKILMLQTTSQKTVYKSSQMIFSILNPQLSRKYMQPPSQTSLIIAANNIKSCDILYYNYLTDQCRVLFTLNNFTNFTSKNFNQKYHSIEFLQHEDRDGEHLVVASSFGNRLFFIVCDWDAVGQTWQFKYSRRIKSRENIVSMKYLQGKKFLIVTETKIYYCLTTNTIFFDVFKNLWELKIITLNLNSQLQESIHQKMTFIDRRLVWINDNKVESCKVMNWRELYTSISKTETLFALYFIILSKYVDSPYLERPPCFKGLEISFPKTTIEQKQLILEYCYLMKQSPLQSLAQTEEFCQLLLPFIFNHQLDNLSDEQLQCLVKYWQEHQVLLVEEIIMSGVDKGWEIAIKNAWMRALMKIAQMGDDYEFPLLKMCGYFILHENNEEVAGKYAIQIIKYMSLGVNKDLHQIEEQQDYEDMIKVFVKILLDKTMFLRLAKYQSEKVVSLFTDLFRNQSLDCIVRMLLQNFVLECTGKYAHLVMKRNSVEEIIYSHCIGTLVQHCGQAIEGKLIPQQAVLVLEGHFSFTKERIFEIITKLISNDKLATKATKIQHKPEVLQSQELEIKSQYLILDLLNLLKCGYETTTDEMHFLLQECQKSRNLELVSIELMKPQKRFESILSKYINCGNSRIKEEVFFWLTDITRQLLSEETPESMKDFNRIVLNRMKELIHINKEKTREYIQTFFKNSEKKLIHRIQNDPQLQLEYVQLVLQSEVVPDEELLNLHISLLCKLQPNQIINVIETNETRYNLDNVLGICLNHREDLDNVIIYLYEKAGEVYKAVAKHLQLFYEEWGEIKKQRWEYFNKRNQVLNRPGIVSDAQVLRRINVAIESKIIGLLADITSHLQHILDLIHRQYNQVELYTLVVSLISKIYFIEEQEVQATRSDDLLLLDKLTQFLGMIIMDLAREGHIDFLIDEVLGRYKSMSLREMKQHIKDVYSGMLSSRTVIENILYISRQHLLELNYYTRSFVAKSTGASGVCSLCEISIVDDETALLFSCGHIYHLECAESQDQIDYCSQCIYEDTINGMIEHPQLSLEKLMIHRFSKLKARNISVIRQQVQKKKKHDIATSRKLDKMKIFDKRMGELSMQTEIIELRLETKMYKG